MATSSISGLSSGLDTASIIDQLMTLEATAQTRLKSQQSTEKSVISALQSLNTSTAALLDKAKSLAKAATWQTVQGTVTGAGASVISVKAAGTAAPTSFTVTVDKLAANHQLAFTNAVDTSDVVVSGAGVKLTTNDGTEYDLDTGGGTLTEVVAAINASTKDTGVTASAVKVADGSYRLLAQSTATGASSSFTLTNDDGSDMLGGATVKAGADAQISLGSGITATSSSNTFTGLIAGVDLTLDPSAAIGTTATVTVAQSTSTIKDSVKDLVDTLNKMLSTIDTQTARATSTTAKGVLAGEPAARELRNALLNSVFGESSTMAEAGVQTDRYGKLVFDADKFDAAYAADPAAVAALFTTGATTAEDGFAARVEKVAKRASDSIDGTLTTSITSHNSAVTRYTKSIDEWDNRLALRRESLERQYAALETALSSMQSQGSWLSSQIAGLPSWS